MINETKKVLALATMIVIAGVTTVELTRSPAQADPTIVPGGAAGYAGARIDEAFAVVAEMPPVAPITIPLAARGDLMPAGCGPEEACSAYGVPADEPSVVVETRRSDSSILMRMLGYTMAVFQDENRQSE